ncbi:SGM_5486 family transporter-associated protein [Streptomyces spiramenti]|nr:SGM_5486 family transporter-associated protein [Streptomyces spiramenti]
MPVLEPDPPKGQNGLLKILGAMALIAVVISVIATVASP